MTRSRGLVVALALAVGLVASAATVGCGPSGREEAAALDRVVTAYRQAENAQKPERASSVQAARCTATDVCAARDACALTAKATGEGLARKRKVELALATEPPAPGGAKAKELLDELSAAEVSLARGQETVAACDQAMRAMRKTYSLR